MRLTLRRRGFFRTPCTPFLGDGCHATVMRDANVPGRSGDEHLARLSIDNFVAEGQGAAFHILNPAAHGDLLTVDRWLNIARVDLGDGQVASAALEAGVIAPTQARVV